MAFVTFLCQYYSVYPLHMARTMSKSKGKSGRLDWLDHMSNAVRRYEVGDDIYMIVLFWLDGVYLRHITVFIRYDIILVRRSMEELEEVFDRSGLIMLGQVKILTCLITRQSQLESHCPSVGNSPRRFTPFNAHPLSALHLIYLPEDAEDEVKKPQLLAKYVKIVSLFFIWYVLNYSARYIIAPIEPSHRR